MPSDVTDSERPAGASPWRTPLHGWHRANGARMVEFAGWEMPVRYRSGIVAEHLATRRNAGLFDVSHMGRFRIRGPGSEAALCRVLTNDAAALAPGRAHYTFIANERGGAVDDAYLYRFAEGDFLLVVNASNRACDFEWIEERLDGEVRLTDESEALAMIALQGPGAERMLESIVPAGSLPEGRRGRHTTIRFEGTDLVVARTGYTGERVCFELFAGAERIESLWARLAAAGAVPVGLGARDSLRLQAGLPLYGHELGADPEGVEIPIFANALARFGVRRAGSGSDYVGRTALERQRKALERLEHGEAGASAVLPRVVAPIAVSRGRRPLRAGQRVLHGGVHAGYVTSGTSVPTGGDTAAGRPEMRPIGLALVDSALRFHEGEPVRLHVRDTRGNESEVAIVAGNR